MASSSAPADHASDSHLAQAPAAAVQRLIQLLRLEKQGLTTVIVYAVGIGLTSLAAPVGVQMLVSAIAFGGLVQPIAILSILVLVALTFGAILRATQVAIVERIQQRLFVRVAADFAQRLPRMEVSSFDSAHAPEHVNRFFEVITLQKGASILLLDGILVVLQVIVGGTLLALYHPALLGFAAAVLIAVVGILFGLSGRGATTSIKESKAKYALVAWFEEIASHPTVFRGQGGPDFARKRSDDLARNYIGYRKAHFRILFRQTAAFLALEAVASASLLGIGGFLVLGGKLTLGQLVASELILTSVVAGLAKFGKYLETYYDLVASMDKLGGLVEIPLERERSGVTAKRTGPLALKITSVDHVFGLGSKDAPVTLAIEPGARLAIIGLNGSGKSTLIDLLYGLREPTRGHIEIDGLPLRDLSLGELRNQVALVRGAAIFNGTVLENICMNRENISLDDVRRALEIVGLWGHVASLPDGLGSLVTTDGGNLSAGQAQRLAIARAIVVPPRCLLLDEALDHLDPDSHRRILEQLLGDAAPWTVVVATHDPSIAAACTQALELSRRPDGVRAEREPLAGTTAAS